MVILYPAYRSRRAQRSRPTLTEGIAEQLFREKRRLEAGDFLEAGSREGEELLELIGREGRLFAAALDFYKLATAGHDDVCFLLTCSVAV